MDNRLLESLFPWNTRHYILARCSPRNLCACLVYKVTCAGLPMSESAFYLFLTSHIANGRSQKDGRLAWLVRDPNQQPWFGVHATTGTAISTTALSRAVIQVFYICESTLITRATAGFRCSFTWPLYIASAFDLISRFDPYERLSKLSPLRDLRIGTGLVLECFESLTRGHQVSDCLGKMSIELTPRHPVEVGCMAHPINRIVSAVLCSILVIAPILKS